MISQRKESFPYDCSKKTDLVFWSYTSFRRCIWRCHDPSNSEILVAAVALLGIIRLIMIGNVKIALYTVGVSFLVFIAGTVIFAHGLIGGGDVKLITAVALLIGYRDSIGFLLLAVICGAVQYVIAGMVASTAIPLGVAIAIAGSMMLLIRRIPLAGRTGGSPPTAVGVGAADSA